MANSDPYVYTRTSCNGFTIGNSASFDLDWIIKIYDGNDFIETNMNGTIPPTEQGDFTLPAMGIYLFIAPSPIFPEVMLYTIIINDCDILACELEYLKQLICLGSTNCTCTTCDEKKRYNFNAFVISNHTLFMLQNNIETITTPIEISALNELNADISMIYAILEQLSNYCLTCNKPCEEC